MSPQHCFMRFTFLSQANVGNERFHLFVLLCTDVRQRLGKRPHSPEVRRSVSPVVARNAVSRREPLTDVRSRLGVAKPESRGLFPESSKDKKTGTREVCALLALSAFIFWYSLNLFSGGLWSRLGPSHKDSGDNDKASSRASSSRGIRRRDDEESDGVDDEEDDSQLQKVWGAMIKQKEQQSNKMKKSRLDNLPSLQIEISRDSSNGSDSDSWLIPTVGSVGIGEMVNAVEGS